MGIFNPLMLDASIRDVVSSLPLDKKVDVLLYSLQHLPANSRSRTIIENAVQSCLQTVPIHQENVIRARLIRAKARFAAGLRGAAHQDLQSILLLDPDHTEARQLLPQMGNRSYAPGEGYGRANVRPHFSPELWREIALYLPRRDLRSLLFVPDTLSTIASHLLFRKLHLQFGSARYLVLSKEIDETMQEAVEIDNWHAQRSADILTRIVSNPTYAGLVRTLVITAPERDSDDTTLSSFQTGMLSNALSKLTNLNSLSLTMGNESLAIVLKMTEKWHSTLKHLGIYSTSSTPPVLPHMPQLTRFWYRGPDVPASPTLFKSELIVTLRTLALDVSNAVIPSGLINTNNLTSVELYGRFADSQPFLDLLQHGHHLEILRIKCGFTQTCTPSSAFRARKTPMAALREFSLIVFSAVREFNDPDLFPSVVEFVRKHPGLKVLKLWKHPEVLRVGYDAAVWGVLPALVNVQMLSLEAPKDLSPSLLTWLIPRTVIALELWLASGLMSSYVKQFSTGLPTSLKSFSVNLPRSSDVDDLVRSALPRLRLLGLNQQCYTVLRDEGTDDIELDEWPKRRALFYARDWLELLDCEERGVWSRWMYMDH